MALTKVEQFFEKKTYSDKLLDGRWEDFRASYISRHGTTCQSCKRSNITAQVHHVVYEKGREPWEYDDQELMVLCRGCHQQWHKLINAFRLFAGRMPVNELQIVVGSLSVLTKQVRGRDLGFALAQLATEPETLRRLRMTWEHQK